MEQNKYFTPDIEDIRVGYEGEINWSRGYSETFVPFKITVQNEDFAYTGLLSEIVDAMDDGYAEVKTPYLTKEQIEAEGWTQLEDKSPFTSKPYKFRKIIGEKETGIFNQDSIYTLEYYGIGNTNLIIHLEWESSWNRYNGNIFKGTCKDINTLRYICKLLGI